MATSSTIAAKLNDGKDPAKEDDKNGEMKPMHSKTRSNTIDNDDDDADDDADEDEDVDGVVDDDDDEKGEKVGGGYWVYVLESCASAHYSYVGFTVNRERRLRQHNGELACGGAKYTKLHRPWRMVMSISVDEKSDDCGWWTKSAALQLEWRCKHVSKGRSGQKRRRARMGNLQMRRWKTIRIVDRPAVERRINDIFWLLHNRKKWTRNAPEWKPGRSLRIELHPSLANLTDLKKFVTQCSYWQPTLHTLPSPLPKIAPAHTKTNKPPK